MEKLGINSTMIIVQMVNFGLLFFILKRYLAKPIVRAIKLRAQEIEQVEEAKAGIETSKQKAQEEHDKILVDTQKQAEAILADARNTAEEEKRNIIAAANVQAKKIVGKAKLQPGVKN